MEPVTALFGAMAALPQCIQSAKDLYDLRSRYKDASVLITAIYSESMVIAASLSQVQNLLQNDALQSKPQLIETFDRALTGCRIVYGCLEDEVRDLVIKTQNEDLRFKDRAKFLWKEDTFKELLTQIRGQQSALSLLIQGLQMESISDIRRLVAENSLTLDKVVQRSKSLRQSHPRVHVPESLFNKEITINNATDAESIMNSADFTFDDEVLNSKAYRRAMALYTLQSETMPDRITDKVIMDHPPAYESQEATNDDSDSKLKETDETFLPDDKSVPDVDFVKSDVKSDDTTGNDTDDLREDLDSIEKELLPFMLGSTSGILHYDAPAASFEDNTAAHGRGARFPQLLHENSENYQGPLSEEVAPPLPPRRPSGIQPQAEKYYGDQQAESFSFSRSSTNPSETTSLLSKVSTNSTYTIYEPSNQYINTQSIPSRKALPLTHQASQAAVGTLNIPALTESSISPPPPSKINEMHGIWQLIVEEEQHFVDRMTKLRKMFYDNVLKQWPLLEGHIEAILIGEELANLNRESLLHTFQEAFKAGNLICDPLAFADWVSRVHPIYRNYCQRMPHAISSLRTTQTIDAKFHPFVNTVGLSLAWFGRSWEDYLKLPVVQLGFYTSNLEKLLQIAEGITEYQPYPEAARLRQALEAVQWLKGACSALVEDAQNREDIKSLEKKIHTLDSDIFSRLRLLDSHRRIAHQGVMAVKLKSQGPWVAVHVVLLDNYLFWGKVKPQKKSKEHRIMVLDTPIAVNALQIEPSSVQHEFQRATMFDEIPRGSVVYIISIKDKNVSSKAHLFGAFSFQEHKVWTEHLQATFTVGEHSARDSS